MHKGRVYLEPGSESPEADNDLLWISEDQPLLGSGLIQSDPPTRVGSRHGLAIICCTVSVLFINCALNGLVTLNVPQLSLEFQLQPGVELWYDISADDHLLNAKPKMKVRLQHYRPMSMYYLAQGCTFLLAGSLADVLGSRKVFLSGCFLQIACYLSSTFAQTGMQLIALRTLSGVAYPMCFVSAMSIHRDNLPNDKLRKLAFACTSGSQYVGSAFGIFLSGVLSETIGWRWGFQGAAVLSLLAFLPSLWIIAEEAEETKYNTWTDIAEDIDWAGTLLASSLMALLFSALAYVSLSHKPHSKLAEGL